MKESSWGKTRVKQKRVEDFFRSLTWSEIISRLEGKNPIVFIIMKKASGVHNVVIKAGESFTGVTPDDIQGFKKNDIDAETKKQIDEVFHADIVAKSPPPRIMGLEPHPDPLVKRAKREPAPAKTLEAHEHELGSSELPDSSPENVSAAIESAKVKQPEPEPVTPPVAPPPDETIIEPESNGEVDLQVGMKIIYEKDGHEHEGQIVDLFEEEAQLLVAVPGTRKKDIIDADKIKRLASNN